MLVYVDDVLHIAKDEHKDMFKLNQVYLLREGFVSLDIYLGTNVDKFQLEDGRTV